MECSPKEWDCTTLGVLSLCTTVAIGYFLVKMVNTFRATRLHAFETVMVALAGAQTSFSTVHFLIHHSSALEFTVKYFRSILITCSLSNTMSPLLYTSPVASRFLLPGMGVILLYISCVYIAALIRTSINCSHPTWMVMSISDALLALSFAAGGLCVLRRLSSASAQVRGRQSKKHSESFLAMKTTQLRILAPVNSASSILQLVLDLVVGLQYTSDRGCNLLSSEDTVGVLLFLILLRILSYAIPVWVILYTFYWLPRRQYDTDLDLHLGRVDGDILSSYALVDDDHHGTQVGALSRSLTGSRSGPGGGNAENMHDFL